ncbi:MAG: efflux RND transporter periplasmic adaptor subunit [Chitinophagaceae bacterium]|nr:efflux RND transporter periplasmic adaptor subunit [Chitinophagaceae bacterium]MCA6459890.1 efflux RND transporter periplasmic adaptor subunit [Chitinophagaceae bacterium]MCA6465749.1 efflux RND transporter periplasmic adaptor subunit [Chitinophagaceae bacterium]MEA3426800.1 efflux RND transporter periplasmic adaptor subunit [Bacteroidota bacterium]
MNKKLLWIIIALVVLIVALIGLKKAGVIGKEEGIKVTSEKAALRTIIETVNASGKVYPEIEVKVSPDISGEIVELNVNEGDSVRKGQVLARIYADIYLTQRDQVAAGVNQSKAQLSNSTASLAGLKATLDNLKNTYERQKKLYNEKVVSRAEFETSEQNYLTAQANYNAAREGLKSSEASIQSAQAQLQKADKDLSRTVIVSPMNGMISLMNVKKGERVAGNSFNVGTEMMRVADMRSIEVRVDVGENDIPKVKLGDTAVVEVDAYTNRKFKGLVYKIANPSTSGLTTSNSSAEVTNYKVHIRLLPESYKDLVAAGKGFPFRPGMSASADIQTRTKQNVLSVALNAVTTRDKNGDAAPGDKKDDKKPQEETKSASADDGIEEVVFVLQKDNKVKKVKVKTAIQDLNYIEILEGLKAGDEVITGPYSIVSKTLKDGNLVTVVPKDKLFEEKKSN